jgi:hypothetical protein
MSIPVTINTVSKTDTRYIEAIGEEDGSRAKIVVIFWSSWISSDVDRTALDLLIREVVARPSTPPWWRRSIESRHDASYTRTGVQVRVESRAPGDLALDEVLKDTLDALLARLGTPEVVA